MSSAEWNVVGLLLNLVGLLLLFSHGLPRSAPQNSTTLSWLGLAMLTAGTACQLWANIRWVG
jgi:hypothetical protein